MKRANEKGVALILALILLLVLSVMAVSLMFVSQTETWSGLNYRMMSQARYAAESGLNTAANYLVYNYPQPGTPGDPLANYNVTVSPVTAGGSPVILSANSGVKASYPVSSVQDSFNAAAKGSLTAGNVGLNYAASATLLSMQQVLGCNASTSPRCIYGSATPMTIQTWQITSDGTISGIRSAQVEVSGVLERQATPMFNYAAFANFNGCTALDFGGGGTTDSYDSTTVVGGKVTTQQYGGNVGTNGNLAEIGNPTTIYGSLSTPRTGVGTCTASNVTAWTDSGNAKVTGGLIQLPQPINYPPPDPPNPLPPTSDVNLVKSSGCPKGLTGCTSKGPEVTLAPGSYGNLKLTGGITVHLTAGNYSINSISLAGNSTVVVDSGPAVVNVAGQSVSGTVVDFTGGTLTNASLIPANFQVQYAGSGNIALTGGAAASGLVYAPNSSLKFAGGGDWYGAVIANLVTDMGGAAVHYDRRLKREFFNVSPWMMESFTWKKY